MATPLDGHSKPSNEVRIHYLIPAELHRLAKAKAAISGLTLKDYVIGVLQDSVADYSLQGIINKRNKAK